MIGITAVALTATTAINTIVQAGVFSTVLFGAIAYKRIPKPILRKCVMVKQNCNTIGEFAI